jgi:hypothetical protein
MKAGEKRAQPPARQRRTRMGCKTHTGATKDLVTQQNRLLVEYLLNTNYQQIRHESQISLGDNR